MKKLNSLLIAVAFLFSSSAMAYGFCNDFRNEMSCNDNYECIWADGSCVDFFFNPEDETKILDVCLQAQGIDECNALTACTWLDGICIKM